MTVVQWYRTGVFSLSLLYIFPLILPATNDASSSSYAESLPLSPPVFDGKLAYFSHLRIVYSMDGETELMPPPAVPYTAYIATIWSFVAISGATLICRVVSRFQGPRRLYWDDALVVFSWLLSLATAATWQWAVKDMYYIMNVQAGKATYDASRYLVALRVWLNASLIAAVFFYTGLLLVKLSFLVFFRRLGKIIYNFKYIWWPVLIVTLGSYFSAIGNANYKCLGGTIEQITVVCQRKKELDFTANILKANAALDVLTDLLSELPKFVLMTYDDANCYAPITVMLLPTFLVWNTQIRQSKKLALVGLFSLSIITIVIAITRAVMVDSERRPDGNPDVTWLWFWSAVEPSVGMFALNAEEPTYYTLMLMKQSHHGLLWFCVPATIYLVQTKFCETQIHPIGNISSHDVATAFPKEAASAKRRVCTA